MFLSTFQHKGAEPVASSLTKMPILSLQWDPSWCVCESGLWTPVQFKAGQAKHPWSPLLQMNAELRGSFNPKNHNSQKKAALQLCGTYIVPRQMLEQIWRVWILAGSTGFSKHQCWWIHLWCRHREKQRPNVHSHGVLPMRVPCGAQPRQDLGTPLWGGPRKEQFSHQSVRGVGENLLFLRKSRAWSEGIAECGWWVLTQARLGGELRYSSCCFTVSPESLSPVSPAGLARGLQFTLGLWKYFSNHTPPFTGICFNLTKCNFCLKFPEFHNNEMVNFWKLSALTAAWKNLRILVTKLQILNYELNKPLCGLWNCCWFMTWIVWSAKWHCKKLWLLFWLVYLKT